MIIPVLTLSFVIKPALSALVLFDIPTLSI